MLFKIKLLINVFTMALLLLFIASNAHGQDNNFEIRQNIETPYVRWISEFPIPKNKKKSTGIFRKIGKFFWGKTPIVFNKPISVIGINTDSYWVLDQGNGKIIQVSNGVASVPSFITKAKYNFSSLLGLVLISNNEFLFTDSRLNQIYQINIEEKKLQLLNDTLKLEQPTGIAFSSTQNEIWVVETAAHQISILNKEGKLIKKIGERGVGPGEFNFPTFIWIDKLGHAYVVDAMNFRIQIFDQKGNFLSMFGEIGDGSGNFARPKGIATDTFGNIYIVDALFHVVQIFDRSGNFLYRFGMQGHGNGQFWMPTGIYIDDENYIYVADSYNSRIQVFELMNGR